MVVISQRPHISLDLTRLHQHTLNRLQRDLVGQSEPVAEAMRALQQERWDYIVSTIREKWHCEELLKSLFELYIENGEHLLFLALDNVSLFKKRGIFEKAIVRAHTTAAYGAIPYWEYRVALDFADKDKLRLAGDPVPDRPMFSLYRGVCEPHDAAARGVCWTLNSGIASWFAHMHATYRNGTNPAVFEVSVPKDRIMFCTNDRQEEEFVITLTNKDNPQKLRRLPKPHKPFSEKPLS